MYTLRLGMVANLLLQQSAFTELEGRHEQRYERKKKERISLIRNNNRYIGRGKEGSLKLKLKIFQNKTVNTLMWLLRALVGSVVKIGFQRSDNFLG
jgi:hypothetical protein